MPLKTPPWIVENGGCGGIYHAIDEQDLERILCHPATDHRFRRRRAGLRRSESRSSKLWHLLARLGRYVRERKSCRSKMLSAR